MAPKKLTALKMISDNLTQEFVGTNNVLLTRFGKIYEAQGQHNVRPLQDIGIKKFKKSCRAEIPIASINSVNDKLTNNGYKLYVIYRGEGGAVHYHPFNNPDTSDRRSELTKKQRTRLRCSEQIRKTPRKPGSAYYHNKNGKAIEVRRNELISWLGDNTSLWYYKRDISKLTNDFHRESVLQQLSVARTERMLLEGET